MRIKTEREVGPDYVNFVTTYYVAKGVKVVHTSPDGPRGFKPYFMIFVNGNMVSENGNVVVLRDLEQALAKGRALAPTN